MKEKRREKSIFRSLFVPMIVIMVIQAILFYVAAVYGGIEKSLSRNAVDILTGSLNSRKSEIETAFTTRWTELDDCIATLCESYTEFQNERGANPFFGNAQNQIDFLSKSGETLIGALRTGKTNGIFLILNDEKSGVCPSAGESAQKYGICIRDMEQEGNYSGREDLLLERAPTSIVDSLGCLLDSWWEAKYTFEDYNDGDFYYAPLFAAFGNQNSESVDLAFISDAHRISGSDPMMISYSVPLRSKNGTPFAVLGVELSVNYISSLLPAGELYENDKGSYIVARYDAETDEYKPSVGTGALYSRCFGETEVIRSRSNADNGGFIVIGRDGTELYSVKTDIITYNNSPFESRRYVLIAMVEQNALFSHITHIKSLLFIVALLSLILGIVALIFVSRRFAAPITALAKKAGGAGKTNSAYSLEHIGITEIDRLVDSIEELSINVSRNSTRTEFFSRMSHDMRTPMNAIISFSSEELLESADDKTKDDYLSKIHESGVYLLGLINEVLDMTKIESSKTELRLSKIRATELFDSAASMINELALTKNVNFSSQIELPSELFVMVDKQHLSQIVINLLSNAVKFTQSGGEVALKAEITDGNFRITVSDTGVGMSEEFMQKLYTPFAQENENHEGTGLGLSISKKLIELMNGSIECKSEKNKGTTFTLLLPVVTVDGDTAENAEQNPDNADISLLAGKRVLVCEDNEINLRIIKLLLSRAGITVEEAYNGQQGVELFRNSQPYTYDAILMDIRMPVLNGLEAVKIIRSQDRKDALTVPIIAMTADAFIEDEQTSLSAGMNAHLSKPIEISKLYATLLKYMK